MIQLALRAPDLSRPSTRILLVLIVVLGALLFIEWRSTRVPATGEAAADTMCVAARIGLPCRS